MKKPVFRAALLLCVILALTGTAFADSVPKPVLNASESVVRIAAEYTNGTSSGSGFAIFTNQETTLIATNWHVVEGSPYEITVWAGEDETATAQVFSSNQQKDLCILKLSQPFAEKPLALSSNVEQGDGVYAAGFPAAADVLSDDAASDVTITDGIVSAMHQTSVTDGGPAVALLQINAAVNEGNSGGPLLNAKGEVVGITSLGITDSQGIFGAIAVTELEGLMTDSGVPVVQPSASVPAWVWILCGCIAFAALVAAGFFLFRKKGWWKAKKTGGTALRGWVESRPNPLTIEEAVSLLMPAAVELKKLHDGGTAHLEISPDTVRLKGGRAILAKRTGNEASRYATGFAAPEIYRSKNAGGRSDIYSFCAVLRYLVTGTAPENALERAERMEPEELPAVDPALADILQTGMEPDPENRYQTMQELIYALTPYNTGAVPERADSADRASVKAAARSAAGVIHGMFRKSAAAEAPAEQTTGEGKVPENSEETSNLEETPPEAAKKSPEKKQHKRLKAPAITAICIAALLVLAAGAYGICYTKAVTLAESGDYSGADRLLLAKFITTLHDKELIPYVAAGRELESGQYDSAEAGFQSLSGYRNAAEMAQEAQYYGAAEKADANDFDGAIADYTALAGENYKDSAQLVLDTRFRQASYDLYQSEDYNKALVEFMTLSNEGYSKADDMCLEARYVWGTSLLGEGKYADAYQKFTTIRDYKDAQDRCNEAQYCWANELVNDGEYFMGYYKFVSISGYKDTDEIIAELKNTILQYIDSQINTNFVWRLEYGGTVKQWLKDAFGDQAYAYIKYYFEYN